MFTVVHVRMADTKEIVFNDDVMETEFNEVLLEYLEMKRRSSRDEDASDEDVSSSGNDSDISSPIIPDIVGVEPPLSTPSQLRLPVPVAPTSRLALDASARKTIALIILEGRSSSY